MSKTIMKNYDENLKNEILNVLTLSYKNSYNLIKDLDEYQLENFKNSFNFLFIDLYFNKSYILNKNFEFIKLIKEIFNLNGDITKEEKLNKYINTLNNQFFNDSNTKFNDTYEFSNFISFAYNIAFNSDENDDDKFIEYLRSNIC